MLQMTGLMATQPQGLLDCGIIELVLLRALYLAAICHDYDHPGASLPCLCWLNNIFPPFFSKIRSTSACVIPRYI